MTATAPSSTATAHPSALSLYHRNARLGDLDSLRASLRANGQYKPVVVNAGTFTGRPNEVLAGNHTVKAIRDLAEEYPDDERWQAVLVHVVDVDDDRAARIVLADNRVAELGHNSTDALVELLRDLPDLDGTGYTDDDLAKLIDDVDVDPVPPDPHRDDVPTGPSAAVTRAGDVWELGPHVLFCGDCTDPTLKERLGVERVDLIATDPPYCSGGFQEKGKSAGSVGTTATHKQVANDRLSTRGYQALIKGALAAIPADFAYVFTDWRMWVYLFDCVESTGFGVRSMIVWNKGTPGLGRGWRAQHELVMWASKATPPFSLHHPGKGNVLNASRTGNTLHTTQKPVDIMDELFDCADFATTVFDPFGGSGTTLIAADARGITAYLTEIDPLYCDIICRRYQQQTGTLPVLRSTGAAHDFEPDPLDAGEPVDE